MRGGRAGKMVRELASGPEGHYKELAYVTAVMGKTKSGRTGGDVITLVVVVSRHQGTKEKKGDLSSFCINPG